MMNQEQLAEKLIPLVGGEDNISKQLQKDASLYITVKDEGLVDLEKIHQIEDFDAVELTRGRLKITVKGFKNLEEKNMGKYETLSKDIVKRLTPIANKRNITLNVIGDTANVYGARKILDEMIYNLCDNAIKYNKDNGTVDVIINTTDNKVNLTVRDTGIGIPQNEQSRVFERFYRVDKSHSKLVGGTGLGLAIVKHGAAFHDAEVSLESTEEKGTSVTITFTE